MITTAGDIGLGFALDDPPKGWQIEPGANVKGVTAALLADEVIGLDDPFGLSGWLRQGPARFEKGAALRITISDSAEARGDVVLRPPFLAVGIGCERGAAVEEVGALLDQTLDAAGLSPLSIACLASIDVKMDEPA